VKFSICFKKQQSNHHSDKAWPYPGSTTAEVFGFQAFQACRQPSINLYATTTWVLRKDFIRKGA
jgi:hypothetical protein